MSNSVVEKVTFLKCSAEVGFSNTSLPIVVNINTNLHTKLLQTVLFLASTLVLYLLALIVALGNTTIG